MSVIEISRKRKKTGGRVAGVVNKKTAEVQKQVSESGLTPLEYMLEVMRDLANEPRERLNAAQAAAPYVHAKLSTIDLKSENKHSLVVEITRFGQDKAT